MEAATDWRDEAAMFCLLVVTFSCSAYVRVCCIAQLALRV